jgi:hypothetical protein
MGLFERPSMKGFDGIVSLNGQSRDASFVEGYDFLMRGTTIKVLDGDGVGFVKIGGGTRLFTGNGNVFSGLQARIFWI